MLLFSLSASTTDNIIQLSPTFPAWQRQGERMALRARCTAFTNAASHTSTCAHTFTHHFRCPVLNRSQFSTIRGPGVGDILLFTKKQVTTTTDWFELIFILPLFFINPGVIFLLPIFPTIAVKWLGLRETSGTVIYLVFPQSTRTHGLPFLFPASYQLHQVSFQLLHFESVKNCLFICLYTSIIKDQIKDNM